MSRGGALAVELQDAARAVARVAQGRSLAEVEALDEGDPASRAARKDLTYGTLRRFGRGQAIVRALSRRPTEDVVLEALLWCALYALDSRRYADYTVVDQAVRACGLLEKWTAKSYVNALLRRYLREHASFESRIAADVEASFQHPSWWIEIVRRAYPEGWKQVLAAGNTHPPMALRVNRRRTAVASYRERLSAQGMASRALGHEALLLERPVPAASLPGFADGEVSVQDAGAQRAAHCLDLDSGMRVLDACAAPGGKAAHMLELAQVDLTALDSDAARAARIAANFERLGLAAHVRAADCTQLAAWWDGKPFDRILADVPCSASGVARRHPDLKWLRRASDVAGFAERQRAILSALWQALRPGGKLLYVTCSVFPQENEEVVEAFLARAQGAQRVPLADGGAAQWLPDGEHDGFFHALIAKRA